MSAPALRAYDAAAVVIPAHNDLSGLQACLRAVLTAALCAPLPVTVVVVLDACDDDSFRLAGQYGQDVHFVCVDADNAGAARAAGFGYARSLLGDCRCWYATTDADRRVDPGWLIRQLSTGADVVSGANMGFSSRAYWHVGGFRALRSGGQADLMARFEAAGCRIHRDTALSVIPSARSRARAPQGIAHYLSHLGRSAAGDCA